MAKEFIKLDNTIFYVIKKIKNQNPRADIKRIFDEVTKTVDFQQIPKDSLNDSVNKLLQSNKVINKINRRKDSFFLNKINQSDFFSEKTFERVKCKSF